MSKRKNRREAEPETEAESLAELKAWPLTEYPPAIRNALCLHEAMRKLDVPAEAIYVNIGPDTTLTVLLGPCGFKVGKVFDLAMIPKKKRKNLPVPTAHETGLMWRAAVDRWNGHGTDDERGMLLGEFALAMGRPEPLIAAIRTAQAWLAMPEN
jgi:hypothetical protein